MKAMSTPVDMFWGGGACCRKLQRGDGVRSALGGVIGCASNSGLSTPRAEHAPAVQQQRHGDAGADEEGVAEHVVHALDAHLRATVARMVSHYHHAQSIIS